MSRRVRMLLGLAAAVLPIAATGESPDSPPEFGTGRVVVVPVNLAVRAVEEVEPGLEPVWRELIHYFAAEHPPVVALERDGAVQLWNEVMNEAAAESEASGDLYATYARFARRVAEQAEFASIVFPTIVTRAARVSGRSARWDGVREIVEVPGLASESIDTLREGKIILTRDGATGEMAAASLHVAVFSPGGELRFERMGGLVLLQKLVRPRDERHLEISVVPRPDAFADPAPLREGIAATFAR